MSICTWLAFDYRRTDDTGTSGNVQSADTDGSTVDDCIWPCAFESADYSVAEMDQNEKEIEDLTGYLMKEGSVWS